MLKFDFDYAGFQERFGIQEHGNGSKSRKNKILLAFVKDQFQKKNYGVVNFKTMTEMQVHVWGNILTSGAKSEELPYRMELMGDTFYSDRFSTDSYSGICEDHSCSHIRYCNMEQGGRVYKMKAGKMLHHLIDATEYGQELPEPVKRWLEEDFTQRWTSYCMGMLPENHLIVNTDFKRIYSSNDCVGCFHSCMVDQDHHYFYRDSVEAKAAFLVNEDDMVIARAILWPKVFDQDGNVYRYLDRQYATDGNVVLMRALIDELIKAGEIDCYKVPGCGCSDANAIVDIQGNSLSDKIFHIKCSLPTDGCLSYMDSFKWYDYNNEKAYNSSRCSYDYCLDTTSYSIDDDECDDEDQNWDEYHQEWVDEDTRTVYYHGDPISCSEDWLDDFRYVDSEDEYHHVDDCIICPRCKEWQLKDNAVHSDLIKMDFCCSDCLEEAEQEYKKKNWHFSDFDQAYFESLEELTTFNCWDPELGIYLVRTISKASLEESVSKGSMFLFAGEYCNALNPETHKPYAVWNS